MRHGVDFVVIGGLGATIHGAELPTGDVDITYALAAANLVRMAAVLSEVGADSLDYPGLATDDLPALLSGSDLWRWRTILGDLDMMTTASGAPPYDGLKARSIKVKVREFEIDVASLDDLIAMKRTTGRSKDAGKLAELEELRRLQPNQSADGR